MKPLTELEAQQFLAERLKERIGYEANIPTENHWQFWWKNQDSSEDWIRDTEWQHIAMLVEEKMDVNQLSRYADVLDAIAVPVHICPLTHWHSIVSANYTLRATAMKEAGL